MSTFDALDLQNENKSFRIVGGTEVKANQYPWVVAMLTQEQQNYYDANTDYQCSGVLIAPNVVISAAICDILGQVDYVYIGSQDLLLQQETFKIEQSFVHPSNIDVALYILNRNSSTPTLALNRNFSLPYENETLVVIGYGKTNVSGQFSPIPREAEVNYVTQSDCLFRFSDQGLETNGSANIIDSSNICALGNGKGACRGDSGGPLIQRGTSIIESDNSTRSTPDILMGTTSWGLGRCADPDLPGVYSRISSAIDWIDDTVCNQLSHSSCINGKLMDSSSIALSLTLEDMGMSEGDKPSIGANNGLSKNTIIIVSASVGAAVIIGLSSVFLYFFYKQRKAAQNLTYQQMMSPRRFFGRA